MGKQKNTNDAAQSTDAIDSAINAALARKAARAAGGEKPAKAAKADPAAKRTKVSDEERAARKAKLDAERKERADARKLAREAKRAEKLAARKPAHMSKVQKAASKLPSLSEQAQVAFNGITAGFAAAEIAAIVAHLNFFNRAQATMRAASNAAGLKAGATVRVIGGDPRFVGKTGTVAKAQRIRCYVDVGASKPLYLFTSEVELVSSQDMIENANAEQVVVSTGTEG